MTTEVRYPRDERCCANGYAHLQRRGIQSLIDGSTSFNDTIDGNLPDDAPVVPLIWYGIHSFHYGTIFRIIMIMAAKWWAGERSDDRGASMEVPIVSSRRMVHLTTQKILPDLFD